MGSLPNVHQATKAGKKKAAAKKNDQVEKVGKEGVGNVHFKKISMDEIQQIIKLQINESRAESSVDS